MVDSGDGIKDSGTTKYGGECGPPYESLFVMPNTTHQRQWHSLDVGHVHFLQLSSGEWVRMVRRAG